jgi:hypothetical protein
MEFELAKSTTSPRSRRRSRRGLVIGSAAGASIGGLLLAGSLVTSANAASNEIVFIGKNIPGNARSVEVTWKPGNNINNGVNRQCVSDVVSGQDKKSGVFISPGDSVKYSMYTSTDCSSDDNSDTLEFFLGITDDRLVSEGGSFQVLLDQLTFKGAVATPSPPNR